MANKTNSSDKITTSIHGVLWQGGKQLTPALKTIVKSNGETSTTALRPFNTKKQARGRANREARAAINRDFQGENGSKRAAEYHSKLRALSLGTM